MTFEFVLTAFGHFPGCEVNPTQTMLESLDEFLPQDLLQLVAERLVVEVSAVGSLQALASLHSHRSQRISSSGPRKTLFIHFGTDCSGKGFSLETTGHNEANFRVPDVRGLRLSEPIQLSPVISLKTLLDVTGLRESLASSFPVIVSENPGRYVCNWIYFNSLLIARDDPSATVLFVHVPSTEILPLDQQKQFVAELLHLLHQQEA